MLTGPLKLMVGSSIRSSPVEHYFPGIKTLEMKTIGAVVLVAALGLGIGGAVEPFSLSSGGARGKETIKVRPRMTHEQLSKLQRPRDPSIKERKVRLADIEQPRTDKLNPEVSSQLEKRRESLVARSTIVSSSSSWTILPRGSVLLTPPRFKARVDSDRRGKLVSWRDFYAKNTSWIRLLPVTLDQATGRVPLTEDYLSSLKRTGLLVVAVCEGGPISIRLPEKGKELPELARPVKAADWKTPARR